MHVMKCRKAQHLQRVWLIEMLKLWARFRFHITAEWRLATLFGCLQRQDVDRSGEVKLSLCNQNKAAGINLWGGELCSPQSRMCSAEEFSSVSQSSLCDLILREAVVPVISLYCNRSFVREINRVEGSFNMPQNIPSMTKWKFKSLFYSFNCFLVSVRCEKPNNWICKVLSTGLPVFHFRILPEWIWSSFCLQVSVKIKVSGSRVTAASSKSTLKSSYLIYGNNNKNKNNTLLETYSLSCRELGEKIDTPLIQVG